MSLFPSLSFSDVKFSRINLGNDFFNKDLHLKKQKN
jgi:hypothetical protein